MVRVTWNSVGIADRTSIKPENGAKPSCLTCRWYTPNGRSLATTSPISSVRNVSRNWLASLTSSITLCTPRPAGSVTLKRSSPVLLCPQRGQTQNQRTSNLLTTCTNWREAFAPDDSSPSPPHRNMPEGWPKTCCGSPCGRPVSRPFSSDPLRGRVESL